MWFKNLIFYRFVTPFTLSDEALAEQLSDKAFQLCGPLDHFSQGWSAPLGAKHDQLTFTTSHCTMVCMRKEEKVLPAAVVKEFVGSKVSDIEEQQMRKVGRKEREDIKDEILHDLLPRAFTRSAYTYAYIDRQNGWMIVDSASQKKADDLTTLLRKTLGSLAIELPTTNDMPTACMTHWLKEGNLPTGLNIEDECELKSPDENGAIARCKGQDMASDEIQSHLEAGKLVTKLSVSWDDRLSFTLNDDLTIKRIRNSEMLQDQINDCHAETAEEKFDADFTIMCLEFSHLLPQVMNFFGGEQSDQQSAVA